MIKRGGKLRRRVPLITIAVLVTVLALGVHARGKKPQVVTLSGLLIDLTCATKGRALMGKWVNAKSDHHMTEEGRKPNCATLCLKSGLPAALFDASSETIMAVFACNPRPTLADYAVQEVEVQGFWSARQGDGLNTFVPEKIRPAGSTSWTDVNCGAMHD